MKVCSVVNCQNPVTHYDPIDKEYICKMHLDFLRGCGINIEYREITQERMVQECQK
jgi:hypothetical protein